MPVDKGAHFPKEIMLTDVRWYVAYPLSTTRSSDPLRWEALLHYQCASMWGRRSPRSSLLSSISAALDTRRFRVIRRGATRILEASSLLDPLQEVSGRARRADRTCGTYMEPSHQFT